MAAWSLACPWTWDRLERLPGAHARYVRKLCGGAAHRTSAPWQRDRGGNRGGERVVAVGAATDLPGRVWLPVVCAAWRAAWFGPVHARGRGSADGPGVCVHRMAVSELPIWTAVHARHLPARVIRPGRGAVGAEGDRRRVQPRGGRAGRVRRAQDGTPGEVGGCVRGLESGAAGACGRRRAQRSARAARARGCTGAGGRHVGGRWDSQAKGGGGVDRRGRGREGLGGAGAAIRGARSAWHERASAGGGERGRRARATGGRGSRGLRRARVWFRGLTRRAATANRYAQPSGGDRALGGSQWTTELVARPVCRGFLGGVGDELVAHRARCGLAHDGRLDDACAVAIDRLAAALVCDMGAAARRSRR